MLPDKAAAIAVPVEEAYENYIFHKEVGSTAKIFVDKTNIRDLPGLTGNIVDALPQGTSVKLSRDKYYKQNTGKKRPVV